MILYFLSLIFCLFSPPFSQHPMRPFPLHYFDRRNLGDFSKFFLKFSSFLLPFSKSHARIQLMNQLHMREWLSWWSTTLPRLGSRVRVPSRALKNEKRISRNGYPFLLCSSPAGRKRRGLHSVPVVAKRTSTGRSATTMTGASC